MWSLSKEHFLLKGEQGKLDIHKQKQDNANHSSESDKNKHRGKKKRKPKTKKNRLSLLKFVRIKNAFSACKKRLKEDEPELRAPPSMRVAIERIVRLERENERLKRENAELLQQFVVWQYNAHIHGLSDRELNKALPGIDRGQTD